MLSFQLYTFLNNLHAMVPFSIQRWLSTPAHNATIGGATRSHHLDGDAVDLSFDNLVDLWKAVQYALDQKIGGIEIALYNMHLHLDMRTEIWHVVEVEKGKDIPLGSYMIEHEISTFTHKGG